MSDPRATQTFRVKPPPLAPDPQATTDADLTALETAIVEARVRIGARSGRLGLRQLTTLLASQLDESKAATLLTYARGATYPTGQEG